MSGSPAAPGPSHDSLDSSPPAPGFRSYQQTKLAELALDSSVPPATAPTAPPGSQPFPSPPPESPPPAPTPTPAPAATGPLPTTPPPPATGPLIPTPAWPVSAPYSQPASSSGAPADKSVAGIAAGSAAAGAVLIVLLVAFGLYVVAPIWKRRTGRDRAGAGSSGGGGASQHESQKHHSVVQIEVEVTTPTPTASSSSALGSSSSWATSRESHKPDTHGDGAGPRVQPVPGAGGGDEVLFRGAFTYEQLAAATDGFSESSLVGRGGFGDVHVGTVDGAAVAVKRLRAGSQQGDREFQAELRIISRVHHRNLVSLVGYCVGDGGQRLLVYEFVPNLTLHHHLHAFSATGEVETVLDWPTRWRIAVGAAKGLAYLHEDCHPRIIHRDIKAANILLDPDFNPKVSDFGMAKFVPRGDTHIATRIVGTIGYLAPEYATSGRLTEKSDVFSFGVVLLELVTGMKAAMSSDPDDREEGTLVGWARPLLTKALELHDYDELVDPLLPSFDAKQMACLVRCAAAAVSTSARHRPRMSQIVKHLEGDASSEEEIDAGGAEPLGQSGSTHGRPGGDASAQFHSYSKIRTSRWEARALGHRTGPEQSLLKSSNPIIKKRL